jgi:hypothetical protein
MISDAIKPSLGKIFWSCSHQSESSDWTAREFLNRWNGLKTWIRDLGISLACSWCPHMSERITVMHSSRTQ